MFKNPCSYNSGIYRYNMYNPEVSWTDIPNSWIW